MLLTGVGSTPNRSGKHSQKEQETFLAGVGNTPKRSRKHSQKEQGMLPAGEGNTPSRRGKHSQKERETLPKERETLPRGAGAVGSGRCPPEQDPGDFLCPEAGIPNPALCPGTRLGPLLELILRQAPYCKRALVGLVGFCSFYFYFFFQLSKKKCNSQGTFSRCHFKD